MIDIGFIGLGTTGRPMAHHLLAAGHRVFLHDVAPIAPELKAGGGIVRKSSREVAEEADAVIIMVPNTPHVETVLFAQGGVAEGISKGKIVVDMSSISPLATKEFAKKIEALGAPTISMRRFPAARSAPRQPASPSWWAGRNAPSTP
jgi:2-hydroxy-3-oxopropionate reductase